MPPPSPPDPDVPRRSLADELRTWDDAALARLLRSRPDLAVPLPRDLTSLAQRAVLRPSVQLAVDALDLPTLQVLEATAVLTDRSPAAIAAAWGADPSTALGQLRELALLWGPPDAATLVRAARECLGPHPAGLGPSLTTLLDRAPASRIAALLERLDLPASSYPQADLARIAADLADPARVRALLAAAPAGAREVIERLTWDGPVGRLADADRRADDGTSDRPLEWLLARGLLAPADAEHVVLAREVGRVLRGGRTHREPALDPPSLADGSAPPGGRASAAGTAAEAVRLVAALGEAWGQAPPPVLKAGGLGVRDLRRLAGVLEIADEDAARVVELAYAAGLVDDDGELSPRWAPTPEFDAWLVAEVPRRWVRLARAWLASSRCPGLVGTRDERGGLRNALSPATSHPVAPGVRMWLLDAVTAPGAGLGPEEATTAQALHERLTWEAPRRAGSTRQRLLDAAIGEATWLGLLGPGPSVTAWAAAVRTGDEDDAAGALAAALPSPVDHVLLQADLTAIAPGPLDRTTAAELDLIADVESRGGATVYRFGPTSIRRALDVGRTGEDVLDWLRRHSRTPVPQPLEYLVTDAARRHGRLRVGTAQAFLRCDDEALLGEVLADRRTAELRLRRLAPTVVAAQAPPASVLEVLRGMGLSPAAETADGAVVLSPPPVHRTGPRRRPRTVRLGPPEPGERALLAAAGALRLSAGTAPGSDVPPRWHAGLPGPTEVATLRIQLDAAAAQRRPVWLSFVDGDGQTAQRLVEPISVADGRVAAFDRQTARIVTFPLSRLTAVVPGA